MTRLSLAAAIFFLTAATTAAANPDPADLAVRARATLVKYCGECHAGKPGSRPQLDLLDISQVIDKDRAPLPPFVAPKAPASSQILEFLDAGIMPPAGLPRPTEQELADLKLWIESGANSYPREFNDAFVFAAIRDDIARVPESDRRHMRYLTLDHLAASNPYSPLTPVREALRDAIARVSRSTLPQIPPADPTGTVLRLDLRSVGWNLQPFFEFQGEKQGGPSKLNIFDVILLEYPYGVVPADSPLTREVASLFIEPAAQFRPIPFVRADWLTQALANPLLGQDVTGLLSASKPEAVVPNTADRPPPANAASPRRLRLPLKPIPIPAIDGRYTGDTPDDAAEFDLRVDTKDPALRPKRVFQPGDRLKVVIVTDVEAAFELLWIDSLNSCFAIPPPIDKATKKQERTKPPDDYILTPDYDKVNGFGPLSNDLGKERFTIFASRKDLPAGIRLATVPGFKEPLTRFRAIERYVHLFQFDDESRTAAPAEIVRKSVEIEIVKPKQP